MHCSDVFKCKTFQICNALRGILEWALLNSQNMTQYPLNVKKFYRHVGWPSKYQKWTIIYMYIAWWKIFAPTIQKHALTHQIVQQILSTEVTFLYLEYKIINKENVWQLLEQRVLLSSRDVAILYVIMFFLSGGNPPELSWGQGLKEPHRTMGSVCPTLCRRRCRSRFMLDRKASFLW